MKEKILVFHVLMDFLDMEYMIKIKNIHYITQNIILKKLKKSIGGQDILKVVHFLRFGIITFKASQLCCSIKCYSRKKLNSTTRWI